MQHPRPLEVQRFTPPTAPPATSPRGRVSRACFRNWPAILWNRADPTEHITTVLNGKQGSTIGGVKYTSPMPVFKGILNDADITAIVNHERTNWGNAAPTVSAADVAGLRR